MKDGINPPLIPNQIGTTFVGGKPEPYQKDRGRVFCRRQEIEDGYFRTRIDVMPKVNKDPWGQRLRKDRYFFLEEQIPGVIACSPMEFRELMPDVFTILELAPFDVKEYRFDVKVHMLMPGQYPCIPTGTRILFQGTKRTTY